MKYFSKIVQLNNKLMIEGFLNNPLIPKKHNQLTSIKNDTILSNLSFNDKIEQYISSINNKHEFKFIFDNQKNELIGNEKHLRVFLQRLTNLKIQREKGIEKEIIDFLKINIKDLVNISIEKRSLIILLNQSSYLKIDDKIQQEFIFNKLKKNDFEILIQFSFKELTELIRMFGKINQYDESILIFSLSKIFNIEDLFSQFDYHDIKLKNLIRNENDYLLTKNQLLNQINNRVDQAFINRNTSNKITNLELSNVYQSIQKYQSLQNKNQVDDSKIKFVESISQLFKSLLINKLKNHSLKGFALVNILKGCALCDQNIKSEQFEKALFINLSYVINQLKLTEFIQVIISLNEYFKFKNTKQIELFNEHFKKLVNEKRQFKQWQINYLVSQLLIFEKQFNSQIQNENLHKIQINLNFIKNQNKNIINLHKDLKTNPTNLDKYLIEEFQVEDDDENFKVKREIIELYDISFQFSMCYLFDIKQTIIDRIISNTDLLKYRQEVYHNLIEILINKQILKFNDLLVIFMIEIINQTNNINEINFIDEDKISIKIEQNQKIKQYVIDVSENDQFENSIDTQGRIEDLTSIQRMRSMIVQKFIEFKF